MKETLKQTQKINPTHPDIPELERAIELVQVQDNIHLYWNMIINCGPIYQFIYINLIHFSLLLSKSILWFISGLSMKSFDFLKNLLNVNIIFQLLERIKWEFWSFRIYGNIHSLHQIDLFWRFFILIFYIHFLSIYGWTY